MYNIEKLVGWLCLTSHRQRGRLETAPPFTVPCEGREARLIHRSDRELNPGPSHGSPLRYRCATQAPREFEKQYCSDNTTKRTHHHEFTGGKLSRVTQNAAELSAVFHQHGNPFQSTDEDELYNPLTKVVMTEPVTNDIIHHDEIGQQMFESFVNERLTEGKLSVWDKMSKKKLIIWSK